MIAFMDAAGLHRFDAYNQRFFALVKPFEPGARFITEDSRRPSRPTARAALPLVDPSPQQPST